MTRKAYDDWVAHRKSGKSRCYLDKGQTEVLVARQITEAVLALYEVLAFGRLFRLCRGF
jgi:hypothetical protein